MDDIKEFIQVLVTWFASPDKIVDERSPQLEEMAKLEENCRSPSHLVSVRYIRLNLNLLALDLVRPKGGLDNEIESNSTTVQIRPMRNSSKQSKPTYSTWTNCFIQQIRDLFLVYFVAKFLIITYYKVKYESKLRTWAKIGGKDGKLCGPIPLNVSDEVDPELNNYRLLLELAGDPMVSVLGGSILFYTFCMASVIILLLSSKFSASAHDIRLDFLGFLLEPRVYMEQIQLERHYILTNLLESFNKFRATVHHSPDLDSASYNYASLLLKIDQLGLVRPINLSWHWHKILAFLTGHMVKWATASSFLILVPVTWMLFSLELYLRADLRVAQLECSARSSLLVRPKIELWQLDREEDESLYKQMDTSSPATLFYLGSVVESRYFLRWRQLVALIELSIVSVLCANGFDFFAVLVATAVLDKLVWVNQIVRQLEEGIAIVLHRQNRSEDTLLKLQKLTLIYVNHSLFMWHFASFKTTLNRFLLTPLVLVVGSLLSCSAMVALNTGSSGLVGFLALMALTFVLFLLLLFLIGPSVIVGKIRLQMKLISTLVASTQTKTDSGTSSMAMEFLKQKWREQLLFDRNLSQLLAQQLFGLEVTAENLLKLNSYLVAWWLFVYQKI